MVFPIHRLRRLRQHPQLRRMVSETRLAVADLIYPMFVGPGTGIAEQVPSMPGVYRYSVDRLVTEVQQVEELGIPAVLLFGIPERKDASGTEAYHPDGIVQRAIKAIKIACPEIMVITDVCLCEYTSHGHCGLVAGGQVLNDPTLELLARTALSHVDAGADLVAPSDMMDGRVQAIRNRLDAHGYQYVPIMAYAAKYSSGFYGPFRDAAGSTPQFGDRRGYQMDPANSREAIREVALDLEEGADLVMVKPALAYLDVIRQVRERFDVPVAAYNVSGEYAMVKAAAQNGWIDERAVVMEILTAIKRAGASPILTYHAPQVARWLQQGR